jgi:uncharacterized protein (TIGR02145 family)
MRNKQLNLIGIFLIVCGLNGLQAQTASTMGTITDFDGNSYKTITIGNQVWMAENLKTTRYRNGDTIGTSPTTLDIRSESEPKYQWAYAGNDSNVAIYGRLYTWYATTDPRGVCPVDWHVPSKTDFETLLSNVGGRGYGGYQALLPGGSSGFSALFGGIRVDDGHYEQLQCNYNAVFNTSTATNDGKAWYMSNYSGREDAHIYYGSRAIGMSVRCLKD